MLVVYAEAIDMIEGVRATNVNAFPLHFFFPYPDIFIARFSLSLELIVPTISMTLRNEIPVQVLLVVFEALGEAVIAQSAFHSSTVSRSPSMKSRRIALSRS